MADEQALGPRRGVAPAGLALAVSFAVLLYGASSYSVSHPTRPDPHRDLSILLGLFALIFALAASRKDRPGVARWLAGSALLLAMGGLWLQFGNFLANYSTYPVLPLAVAGVLVTGIAWWRGQRVVAAGMTLFHLVWLGPGFLSPRNHLPLTARSADLYAELMYEDSVWRLELHGPPGRNLGNLVNLADIKLGGTIGPLIALDPAYAGPWRYELPLDTARLSSRLRAPPWARSWSLRLEVPVWPANPAVSLEVPVDPFPGKGSPQIYSRRNSEMGLTVSDVRYAPTRTLDPQERCLALTLTTEGLPDSGFRAGEIRIADQDGLVLEWGATYSKGSPTGEEQGIEIDPVPKGLRGLRIDIFSAEQIRESRVVLDFPSVTTMR